MQKSSEVPGEQSTLFPHENQNVNNHARIAVAVGAAVCVMSLVIFLPILIKYHAFSSADDGVTNTQQQMYNPSDNPDRTESVHLADIVDSLTAEVGVDVDNSMVSTDLPHNVEQEEPENGYKLKGYSKNMQLDDSVYNYLEPDETENKIDDTYSDLKKSNSQRTSSSYEDNIYGDSNSFPSGDPVPPRVVVVQMILETPVKECVHCGTENRDCRHIDTPIDQLINTIDWESGQYINTDTHFTDRIAFVGNRLWNCKQNTISVLDVEGDLTKEVSFPDYPSMRPNAVVQLNHREALLASDHGLFVLSSTDYVIHYQIMDGNFNDVSKNSNRAVAYDSSVEKVFILYNYNRTDSIWVQESYFKVQNNEGYFVTILLDDHFVYLASLTQHIIYKYTIWGDYLQSYGSAGMDDVGGSLYYPYLSMMDKNGTLLICDSMNNRLQLLFPDDDVWRIINVDNGIDLIRDFIIAKNYVYSLYEKDQSSYIKRYKIICN